MATRWFKLQDAGDASPWGVLKFDDKTGSIQRYNDGRWFSYPFGADVILGREPGAQEIDQKTADQLTSSGTLNKLSPADEAYFTGAG